MGIIIFIVILASLILIHEFGHFIVAKRAGIRVDEFGLGFPPRLFGIQRGETMYSINIIPFGGFVKIFGEDPSDEATNGPDRERSFINRPRLTQAAVLGAGVAFNAIVAWVLLSASFVVGFPTVIDPLSPDPNIVNAQVVVIDIAPDSPAEQAGLNIGDRLLSLSREEDEISTPTIASIQKFVAESEGKEVSLNIKRGNEELMLSAMPSTEITEGRAVLGFSMEHFGVIKLPIHLALIRGGSDTFSLIGNSAVGLATFFKEAVTGKADFTQISGPVGIAGIFGNALQFGAVHLLGLTALISANLALVNLLPIPALDGGRLFFVLIEAIRRKALNPKAVLIANTFGFVALIILMFAVTYNDIAQLF